MLVPLSWLRDFAPFDLDAAGLAEVFDDLGMVVDEVRRVGQGLEGVVVGRVLDVRPHPNADRVRLCHVDLGATLGTDVQIACGADNVAAGQLVPVATVGAVLPDGTAIGRRKVRGEWSNGMICSARELALGEDAAGILVLPEGTGQPGQPVTEAMGIEEDVVFDLDIETNRPDALSIAGVARDAAARLRLPFSLPVPLLPTAPPTSPPPSVQVADMCPVLWTARLEGVRVGPSPQWLAGRLTLAGMRPIANLVDVSNYVMLERGQPTHPYDLDGLAGGTIGVRAARRGEALVTLDGVERRLGDGPTPDAVIVDGEDGVVGLAGIMGGASSEIHAATTTVLLEAAHFDRLAIAHTSKRLGLRSEASVRFERGVDAHAVESAVARFVELAAQVSGAGLAAVSSWSDPSHTPTPRPIRVRTARVNGLLGTDLGDDQVRAYLEPIGFQVAASGAGQHDVTPPSFRPDATLEVDVIEEVARHHGYASIPRTVPRSPLVGGLVPYQRDRRRVRDILCGLGLTEAQTGMLVAPGDHKRAGLAEGPTDVVLADDPLAREESVLRTSLRPGLLRAAAFNLDRRADRVALFEIGRVYPPPLPGRELPDEREVLAVVLVGAGADASAAVRVWHALADALRLQAVDLEAAAHRPGTHHSRTAVVWAPGVGEFATVGEVDPDVAQAEGIDGRVGLLEVDLVPLLSLPRRPDEARPVSRYPSSDVDLAFWVDEPTPADEVGYTLQRAGGDLLEWVRLFDVYRGPGTPPGRRGLAYRLRFQALDHTLTDAEVAEARARAITAVEAAHPATLR